MITIFATAKPFRGHSAVIQGNAFRSWAALEPRPDIILFGACDGASPICAELGILQIPHVPCSDNGTPLLSGMFDAARQRARTDVLVYVNADIMLTQPFSTTVARVAARQPSFLLVGQRYNVDIRDAWDFSEGWSERLAAKARQSGTLAPVSWVDVFAFNRDLYMDRVPPFAIGRLWFDSWLIRDALEHGATVVDGTSAFVAVHQDHDYDHVAGGKDAIWKGPEEARNRALYAEEPPRTFGIHHATRTIDAHGRIRRAWQRSYREARRAAGAPRWWRFLETTSRLRHSRLGRPINALAKAVSRVAP